MAKSKSQDQVFHEIFLKH